MRAYVLAAPGPLESRPLSLAELPRPTPGVGQVLILVHVCAACRTDLHVVEGELPVRRAGITPGHQVVGTVEAVGPDVDGTLLGQRVGVAWLHGTCGRCRFCTSQRENLCEHARFSGYTEPGGFAEHMLAQAAFVYPLPAAIDDASAAPLLCAGIIGYRALQRTGLRDWRGARIGIYGFGAAGHIAIQLARARGTEVYVATRERVHRQLAERLGARWVGATFDDPPVRLDASVIFAPAGELVPVALRHLDKGGRLVLGGIHMSDIPALPYAALYGERELRTVANNTRDDGHAFLREAALAGVQTQVVLYGFEELPRALLELKRGIAGAAVVQVR